MPLLGLFIIKYKFSRGIQECNKNELSWHIPWLVPPFAQYLIILSFYQLQELLTNKPQLSGSWQMWELLRTLSFTFIRILTGSLLYTEKAAGIVINILWMWDSEAAVYVEKVFDKLPGTVYGWCLCSLHVVLSAVQTALDSQPTDGEVISHQIWRTVAFCVYKALYMICLLTNCKLNGKCRMSPHWDLCKTLQESAWG